VFLLLAVVVVVAIAWSAYGVWALREYQRTTSLSAYDDLGPIHLKNPDPAYTLVDFLEAGLRGPVIKDFIRFNPHEIRLYLNRQDKDNPFVDDLRSALRQYNQIRHLPGESASKARFELLKTIKDIRWWPVKAATYEADRLVAAMESERQRLIELSKLQRAAYEKVEIEATEEVKRLNS